MKSLGFSWYFGIFHRFSMVFKSFWLSDALVFFTALGGASGYGGHTGGAFDMMPEVCKPREFIEKPCEFSCEFHCKSMKKKMKFNEN